jgi:Na+-translocating ferredoxin:NAD+ oxidoreductase RnfE subunit
MRQVKLGQGYNKVAPGMLGFYLLMLFEFLLFGLYMMPARPFNLATIENRIALPICTMAIGAYVLAKHRGSSFRFFVYGLAGSLLFVPWIIAHESCVMIGFRRDLGNEVLAARLLTFAVGLGVVCWLTAICSKFVRQVKAALYSGFSGLTCQLKAEVHSEGSSQQAG